MSNRKSFAFSAMALMLVSVFFVPLGSVVAECLGDAGDTFTEGDLSYVVNEDQTTVSVTGPSVTSSTIVIPPTVTHEGVTYGVTAINHAAFGLSELTEITIPDSIISIGEAAFMYCESLREINIPKSVRDIGGSALYGCYSLASITVDDGNEYFSSEDGVLFNKDKTTLIQYPIGNERISYRIPDGVTLIDNNSFLKCTNTFPKDYTIHF